MSKRDAAIYRKAAIKAETDRAQYLGSCECIAKVMHVYPYDKCQLANRYKILFSPTDRGDRDGMYFFNVVEQMPNRRMFRVLALLFMAAIAESE